MSTDRLADRPTLTVTDVQPVWHDKAACRAVGNSHFFMVRGHQCLEAKRVCAGCPVLADCLESSIRHNEESGIWAGMGEAQRRIFRRIHPSRAHRDPAPQKGCRCAWCKALRAHLRRLAEGRHSGRGGERHAPLASFGPGATHGRRSTYAKGCRCWGCSWGASALGVLVSKVGQDTSVWWERYSVAGADYLEARAPVEAAAAALLVDLVATGLTLTGAGGWSRGSVEAMVTERLATKERLAPKHLAPRLSDDTGLDLHPTAVTAAA